MSAPFNENKAHYATILAAEGVRQTAVAAAGNSQSAVRTAEIAFARSGLKSAIQNGVDAGPWTQLLASLGGLQS
jgi:hypothetical protein